MKRRKRKRSSKAARPTKIRVDAEKAAGPSTALPEADRQIHPGDEFVAPVEVEKPGSDPTALAEADYVIDLGDEFNAAVEEEKPATDSVTVAESDHHTHSGDEFTDAVKTEKPAEPSAALAGADRRTHPRYEFVAAVEVIAPESGARIETRVRDLSQQGCYVDTNNALPLGTVTDVRIKKGAERFEAGPESSTPALAKAWGWCLRPLTRSLFGFLKPGLPNPAKPPGSRRTAEGVSEC